MLRIRAMGDHHHILHTGTLIELSYKSYSVCIYPHTHNILTIYLANTFTWISRTPVKLQASSLAVPSTLESGSPITS